MQEYQPFNKNKNAQTKLFGRREFKHSLFYVDISCIPSV